MMSHHEETPNSQNRMGSTRRRFLAAVGATGVALNFGVPALAQDGEAAETFVLGGEVEAWRGVAPDEIADEDNPTLELEADETYIVVWENLDGQPHNFAIQNEDGENLPVLEEIDVPEDVPVPSEELGTPEEGTPTPTPEGTPTPSPTPTPEGTPTPTPEGTPEEGIDVSETISEEGAMQAVQFTATEEMAQYICTIHPDTMVGDVSIGGGDGGTPTPEEGDGTPTPTPEE